jgi:hypothetical protein
MSWTPDAFRARWPEFSQASDAEVNAVLTAAALRNDARIFGASYDEAVGLYAAHLLSLARYGQYGQRGSIDQKPAGSQPQPNPYLAEWQRLARMKAGGFYTIGRGPTGGPLT